MLDIQFIRDNPDLIKEAARKKRLEFKVDELLAADKKRREQLTEVEELRRRQKKLSEAVSSLASASPEREEALSQSRQLKTELQAKEKSLLQITKKWQRLMLLAPNIPDVSVPEGESENDNQEIRRSGEPPVFSFVPKDHVALMTGLAWADFERGAKVAGFRGYFLKNDGALLSLAIWRAGMEHFQHLGFTPIFAPSLIQKENLIGTGYLPQGADDLYHNQDDSFLAGTAEAAVMGYFADEVLPAESLPLKFVAFSPCFRREAGSYGRDVKGLIRVHEFFKLELVILCEANHLISVRHHDELVAAAEGFLRLLELPYRLVANCGADLGLGQVKKIDLEVWFPAEKRYRETHSASYFHDFQSRRLNIRYRDRDGKLRFVHSLNNTGAATPRLLAALVENCQQADGSIDVPSVLRPYLGKEPQ